MELTYKQRPIEILQLSGDTEEFFIEEAVYLDKDEDQYLTDEEMDEVLDLFADEIGQEMYERAVSNAEYRQELLNDR